jgi:fructosamine-3-kinase
VPREDATETLRQALQTALGCSLEPAPAAQVAGGSIAECVRWSGDDGDLFVKLAPAIRRQAFEAEAAGLAELATAGAIRIPALLGTGSAGSTVMD